MCNKLYSKTGVGTARSINIEDIEERSSFNPTTYSGYGTTVSITTSYTFCPAIYQYEKGRNGATTGIDRSNDGSSSITMPTTRGSVENGFTSAYYNYYKYANASTYMNSIDSELLIAKNGTNKNYWLASRCVDVYSSDAYFRVRFVYDDSVYARLLCNSGAYSDGDSRGVVPVVSLKSNIQTLGKNASEEWTLIEE